MQQKSDQTANISDFSDRTDGLAHHLGIRIAELTERLDLSRDSLMGYRTGRYPVSKKAWRKLEAAEAAAGIQPASRRVGGPSAAAPPGPGPDENPPIGSVEELCVRIREEFYEVEDRDMEGRSQSEIGEILKAMGEAMIEMDRRGAGYLKRGIAEGKLVPRVLPALEAEVDAFMADVARDTGSVAGAERPVRPRRKSA